MIDTIINIFKGLTSEQIALISIFVTVLIYLLGKYNELKFKKHELKKEKYMEFINLLKETYIKGGELLLDEEMKSKFFDFGSTIFIYGSKKMYKKYCTFREYSSEIVKKCRYYDSQTILYIVADMLNQIRKEIGLYNFELPLKFKAISFFTNGIYFDPNINYKWWKYKINLFLVKFELSLYKIVEMPCIKIIIYFIILPFKLIKLLLKYIVMIPLGKILIKFGIDKRLNIKHK